MRRQRRRKPPRAAGEKRPFWLRLALPVGIVLVLLVFLDSRIRPTVEAMSAYQAKVYATRTVNEALLEELDNWELQYGDLIYITQNSDGLVTSLQTDIVRINRLKTQMAQSIVQELENHGESVISVPVGTLFGNEYLSGRGPRIHLKLIPTGFVQSEIYNSFTTAGINQTLHQVMLRVTVQIRVIIPGYDILTETSTNVVVAETVIVGTVPEAFTQINGDESPVIAKLNDYQAGR